MGRSVTLTKIARDFDASTQKSTNTGTNYSAKALRLSYRNSERDGTMILMGDAKIIIAAHGLAVEPAVGDEITIESIKYRVLDVQRIEQAGTAVVFECLSRRR